MVCFNAQLKRSQVVWVVPHLWVQQEIQSQAILQEAILQETIRETTKASETWAEELG